MSVDEKDHFRLFPCTSLLVQNDLSRMPYDLKNMKKLGQHDVQALSSTQDFFCPGDGSFEIPHDRVPANCGWQKGLKTHEYSSYIIMFKGNMMLHVCLQRCGWSIPRFPSAVPWSVWMYFRSKSLAQGPDPNSHAALTVWIQENQNPSKSQPYMNNSSLSWFLLGGHVGNRNV